MVYHDNDSFLTELTALLKNAAAAQKGSIFFTYKRYTPHADAQVRELKRSTKQSAHQPHNKKYQKKHEKQQQQSSTATSSSASTSTAIQHTNLPADQLHPALHVKADEEPVCLIHAKMGSKTLSTVVNTSQAKSFIRSLNAIMTVHNKLYDEGEQRPTASSKKKKNKKQKTANDKDATTTTNATTQDSKQDASKSTTDSKKKT